MNKYFITPVRVSVSCKADAVEVTVWNAWRSLEQHQLQVFVHLLSADIILVSVPILRQRDRAKP